MFNEIKKLYKDAILSDHLPDSTYYSFYLKNEKQYIGIPKTQITEREIELLSILVPTEDEFDYHLTNHAKQWYSFLMKDGILPKKPTKKCRIIQYTISNIYDEFSIDAFKEAVRSFFPNEVMIVPYSKFEGFIVEEKTDIQMEEDELLAAIQAFESDFFFKVHFYIGKFSPINEDLRNLFQLEKELYHFSLKNQTKEQLVTVEKLIPIYTNAQLPNPMKSQLFEHVKQILNEDDSLSETIKKYIENHSNATLTAKQLFMHRNSLQYRIDKFIEKTSIDIKSFHGAYFAYLACIHAELDEN